jgi:uncharacterized protein YdeI (YjbR/CyaY-like superfamily)
LEFDGCSAKLDAPLRVRLERVKPLFFATPAEWRRWLSKHHASAAELWVGFYKRGSGRPSITWPESVDEALCFGWIDGVRKRLDDERYVIRFTPRRPGSIWSVVNVKRVGALTRRGRMRPAGVRAFEKRTATRTAVYSFEQRSQIRFPPALVRRLKESADAWRYFRSEAPWYRRTVTFWIVSARREETQLKRLDTLIKDSAAGRRIGGLPARKTAGPATREG